MKKERKLEPKNPYSGIERQLLNTYFSGIYISAKEFLDIGRELKMQGLALKSRELLINEIISRADADNKKAELISKLLIIISARVKEYQKLVDNYPKSVNIVSQLIQKANATKKLIQGMLRTNPYG